LQHQLQKFYDLVAGMGEELTQRLLEFWSGRENLVQVQLTLLVVHEGEVPLGVNVGLPFENFEELIVFIDFYLLWVILHRRYWIARLAFIQKSIVTIKPLSLSIGLWARHQLHKDATETPYVNGFVVVLVCNNYLWCTVPSGHDCRSGVSLTRFPLIFGIYENLSHVTFQCFEASHSLFSIGSFYQFVISSFLDML